MSKSTDREYVLNVAQQFLQTLVPSNPLKNRGYFEEISGKRGSDANCFYRNISWKAEEFLGKFRGDRLQRVLCAGLAPDPRPQPLIRTEPIKTSMWEMFPKAEYLLKGDGKEVLRNLAAVSLTAAAYDLCYARHHQGGIRPL